MDNTLLHLHRRLFLLRSTTSHAAIGAHGGDLESIEDYFRRVAGYSDFASQLSAAFAREHAELTRGLI